MLTPEDSFSQYELGLENTSLASIDILEGDTDETVTVALMFQEPLTFHINRDRPDLSEDFGLVDGWEDTYWPTEADWRKWFDALSSVVSERYDGFNMDQAGDCISFDATYQVPATLTAYELGAWIWENTKVVAFTNESDPGTFGSPYLFTLVAEKLA